MGKALVLGDRCRRRKFSVKNTLEEVASRIKWVGKVRIISWSNGF